MSICVASMRLTIRSMSSATDDCVCGFDGVAVSADCGYQSSILNFFVVMVICILG